MFHGIFLYKLRDDADLFAYGDSAARMFEIVSRPEYGMKEFVPITTEDGRQGLIAAFETVEGIAAWREHPEHLETQERGRQEWFESYLTAELIPRAAFDRSEGRRELVDNWPAPARPVT